MQAQKLTTVIDLRIDRIDIPAGTVIGEKQGNTIVSFINGVHPGHIRARLYRGVFNVEGDAKSPPIPKASADSGASSSESASDLHAMNKSQLVEYAATIGIELDPSMKKNEMIEHLEASADSGQ